MSKVIGIEYTLKDANTGDHLDTNVGAAPLEFVSGKGQIIPGLEAKLITMAEKEEAPLPKSSRAKRIPNNFISFINKSALDICEMTDVSVISKHIFLAISGTLFSLLSLIAITSNLCLRIVNKLISSSMWAWMEWMLRCNIEKFLFEQNFKLTNSWVS